MKSLTFSVVAFVAISLLSACTEERTPKSSGSSEPQKIKEPDSGIKIVEHTAFRKTSETRPLVMPSDGAQTTLSISGAGGVTLNKPQEPAVKLEVSNAVSPRQMRRAEGPQTPAMRLEARQHAMAEMLIIRKSAEKPAATEKK